VEFPENADVIPPREAIAPEEALYFDFFNTGMERFAVRMKPCSVRS
jgi:hypothetical protein